MECSQNVRSLCERRFLGGNDSTMNTQMSREERKHGDLAQSGWHFNYMNRRWYRFNNHLSGYNLVL